MSPRDGEADMLPSRWAFVVQFGCGTEVMRGRFAGRIEHIDSGKVGHFATDRDLIAFVTRVLSGLVVQDKSPEGRDPLR